MTKKQRLAIIVGFLLLLGWDVFLQVRLAAVERSAITQYDLTLALESLHHPIGMNKK